MDSTIVVPELPPLAGSVSATTSSSKAIRPLLILIPLRLGLESIYADTYGKAIYTCLSLPQSVGFIGGRPRSAYYFFGFSQETREILCLDPHTVQPHHPTINIENLDEYACENPLIISNIESIDPSLALGFLCQTQAELDDLLNQLEKLNLMAVMRSLPDFGFPDSDEEGNGMGSKNMDMPDTDDEFEVLVCETRERKVSKSSEHEVLEVQNGDDGDDTQKDHKEEEK